MCCAEENKKTDNFLQDFFSVGPIMLRPESRGTVTLKTTSPFDAPLIHANYLSTKHDCDMMVYGLNLCRKIAHSEYFKPAFKEWYFPSKDVETMSDEQLLEVLRNHSQTIYHPMCTAKMGPSSDKDAVVDENLKVHGIDGLRIVDASIFPKPVACHPCAPVVMVAERAADLIKGVA
jgi:choline dehydrogenase